MGFERGQFYTRSRRIGGHVFREYVGGGIVGELAAEADCLKRMERQSHRDAVAAEEEESRELDFCFRDMDRIAEVLVGQAMADAGYHRPKRGVWRKRRGNQSPAG